MREGRFVYFREACGCHGQSKGSRVPVEEVRWWESEAGDNLLELSSPAHTRPHTGGARAASGGMERVTFPAPAAPYMVAQSAGQDELELAASLFAECFETAARRLEPGAAGAWPRHRAACMPPN